MNHGFDNEGYFAYEPYVREMNIWLKYASEVEVVAPHSKIVKEPIHSQYLHSNLIFSKVSLLDFTSLARVLKSIFVLPRIIITVFLAMRRADHIHLRCPGNMGLIGCFLQVFFPRKIKTAKYAGNWDPKSKQPWSYRLQQRILKNLFLTRNMQVLVYGQWPNQTKNILPFFTASYTEKEAVLVPLRLLKKSSQFRIIFVGSLTKNKNPLLSLKVALRLREIGLLPELHFYGDGLELQVLENFVYENLMESYVSFHGNCDKETLKLAYQESHFLVFLSRSEGWPKVVAEAMFWGCVPITTAVSCLPEMLNGGVCGDLIAANAQEGVKAICSYLELNKDYQKTAQEAMHWSRKFTLDNFETEIKKQIYA